MSTGTDNANVQRCRVLVVEDDRASRRALMMLLKLRGFDASHACNLSEALEQLKTQPQFVLLDLMLPDGNGTTILEFIRNNNLPMRVAITSGAGNWESLVGNGPSQPDAIFSKPLQLDRLMEWLADSEGTLLGAEQ